MTTKKPRRDFLKKSAAALTSLTLVECSGVAPQASVARSRAVDPVALKALGESVLPASALGAAGVDRVVSSFQKWLEGFEPVAELDHGYLTSEIEYTPADPAPRWAAQLDALELESQKRFSAAFVKLSVRDRQEMVRRQIRREAGDRLPDPAEAQHVAVGLLAHFYQSTEANDLGFGARIGRYTCRGLPNGPVKPEPLTKEG